MIARSNCAAVRNPILADPEFAADFAALGQLERDALERFLKRWSKRWRIQADNAWRKHKPPMALYWKWAAVNARHMALAARSISPTS